MQSVLQHAPIGSSLHGGHRVIDVLQGGMGVVYISHQQSTGQFHAIKTVRFDGPQEEVDERLRRFQAEVNNWIRVSREGRCPAIVDALAFDADERLLILEFVDGLPLHAFYDHGRAVHPEHALSFAADIAAGMEILHSRFQLLHRDLKPQNVLVTRKGLQAKVTDLGIVKSLDDATCAATRIGTPAYMAPEAMDGRADYRSDIYSYGATVYWMLTGQRAKLDRPPELGLVPAAGRGFLKKCLALDAAARFQSFAEVRAALAELEPADLGALNGGYRICAEHAFHTPVPASGEDVECLFCRQAHGLAEKIATANEAARGSVNPTVPLGAAGGGTMTLAAAPSGAAQAPARAKRLRIAAAAIAVVVLGLLAWTLIFPPGAGLEGTGVGADGVLAANVQSAAKCQQAECKEPVVSAAAFQAYQKSNPTLLDGSLLPDWEPKYCAEHSPWTCNKCSRREHDAPYNRICLSCGDGVVKK